jgi:hypothetical protein
LPGSDEEGGNREKLWIAAEVAVADALLHCNFSKSLYKLTRSSGKN